MLLVRRVRVASGENPEKRLKEERNLEMHFNSILRQIPVRELLMHIRASTRRISPRHDVVCSADVCAKQANAYLFKTSVPY